MTQQEMFAILDAMQPEIRDVKAYLDKMCSTPSLPLVYFKNGKLDISQEIRMDELGDLFGILLPNSEKIIRLECISTANFTLKGEEELTSEEIVQWVNKNFSFGPVQTRIASPVDITVLWPYLKKFGQTLDVLYGKGIQKLPNPGKCPGWLDPVHAQIHNIQGCFNFERYLREKGDVLLFTDCFS